MQRYLLITAAAVWLTACSGVPIAPGATQAEVLARYGKPSDVVALPAGQRLQYSIQPAGFTAFMVDLDAAGRVTTARQVLSPADFARVAVGQWTRSDTLREFGRPASIERVRNWPGDILTYRWQTAQEPIVFYVYLDANQVVQQTGTAAEQRREPWH